MQIGMIGLGRMGANMMRRLLSREHQCVGFDIAPKALQQLLDTAVGPLRGGLRAKTRQAAGRLVSLVNGSGGRGGQNHCRPSTAS
jgi:6-phosphogluconate dehydrogenase (decarboxylating)